ncbi:hypothetical protein IFM46972_11344 [Aspergillus udagawae]|uniref:F-box domain-containing protein n=1 Tax=Aspergillus udagawae TaxID=91492 RepID=A0A8H3SFX6_9EURO|nr:hypothetical protein IFM46972_11344 [Aspergillus udagawae]
MPLHTLPEEVLQEVIDSLPSHQDVASLSLQCRRIHRLFEMATAQIPPGLGYIFVESSKPHPAERALELGDLHRLKEAIK